MRPTQILDRLDPQQREVVRAPAGPVLVSAGAGSGKTRTVTSRIAYRIATGQVPAGAVLAVTHSTRAAGQMRAALQDSRVPGVDLVATRTIHAAALNQLRYFWPQLTDGELEPRILTDQWKTVRDICASIGSGLLPQDVTPVLQEISWAKSTLTDPSAYVDAASAAGRSTRAPTDLVVEAYRRYEVALVRRGVLDHTDLLTRASGVIREVAEVADAVHRRARFLVVDEYQDVDPAQQQLIDAWLGPNADVTVVGDTRQAIYAFKGADAGFMTTFADRYAGAQRLELTTNYRSTAQIVTAANRLAKATAATTGAPEPADLHAAARPGPTVAVRALPDASSEHEWVATQIRGLLTAGHPIAQIAVLARDNATAKEMAEALERAQIAALAPSTVRFFDLPEIRAVVTSMASELERGTDLSGPALLREVLADTGFERTRPPEPTSAIAGMWRSRAALLTWVESFPSAELLDPWFVLEEMRRAGDSGQHVSVDAVTVATVHAAKGLEFDCVFCLGWDASWRGTGQEANLAYVAVTRARRTLTLTYAQTRGERQMGPSPLLAHLQPSPAPAVPVTRRRPPGKAAAATCRRCRRELLPGAAALALCSRHLTGPAAAAWAAVVAWRTDQSTISGIESSRILTNAAALALVAARPVTLDDLVRVPGIGPGTVARHGHDLLALMARP